MGFLEIYKLICATPKMYSSTIYNDLQGIKTSFTQQMNMEFKGGGGGELAAENLKNKILAKSNFKSNVHRKLRQSFYFNFLA